MRLRALFVGCLLSLDACGGGAGGTSSSLPSASGVTNHPTGVMRNVTFTVVIPRKGSGAKRTPQTVSASTQSVTAAVNGAAPQAFNVALTSAGCGPGSSGTACTFTVAAPVGADTFELITWDAPGGTGNPLNVGDAAVNIATDSNTNVPVTMTTWAVSNLNDSGTGSLRQILSGVSKGDTVGFAVRGQISLTSATLLVSNDITLQGPPFGSPVAIDGHNTMTIIDSVTTNLTINNLTLQHGNAGGGSNGGAISSGTNNLTLNNDVVQNNQAGNLGGALYIQGGTVIISGCTFQGNTANGLSSFAGEGGAIAMSAGSPSTLTVTGSTFFGNTVASQLTTPGSLAAPDAAGGAIAGLTTYSQIVLLNDQFTSNTATENNGGDAKGGAVFSGGSLFIHGGTFNSNTASATSGNSDGGALNTIGNTTIDNVGATSSPVFSNNSAANGGGWEIGGGVQTVSHTSFTNNTANGAGGSGGAIDGSAGSASTFDAVTFTGNTAVNLGGAFEANLAVTITNSTFANNAVTGPTTPNGAGALDFDNGPSQISNSSFSSNASTGDGGAMTDYSGIAGNTIANTTFINNTAVKGGGAFYDVSGAIITGSSFTGNTSTGTLPGGGAGGAIYAYGTAISTTTIDGNTATEAGGGIVTGGGSISIAQSTISNNHVTGSAATDGGGGIYVNNYASPAAVNIVNSTITGNTAGSNGGGILNSFPSAPTAQLSLLLVTLANNSAGVYGGNLYNATQAQITVNNHGRHPQAQRHPFAGASPSVSIANSVLVGGWAPSLSNGPDIYAAQYMTSGDYNFIQTANAGPNAAFLGSNAHGMQPDASIVLGSLQSNGGPTKTMALTAGDAIHVIPTPCPNASDQRGFARPSAGNTLCSAGAYEP